MTFHRTSLNCAVTGLLFAALACGGDSSGPGTPQPESLSQVSGANQTGAAGRALAEPLVVRVRDSQNQPIAGVVVSFAIAAGTGTVASGSVETSADGTASTTWTLGREAGTEQRVTATVPKASGGNLQVAFTATAQAGAPVALTRVSGDGQQGGAGAPLRDSLVVSAADEFGNPVQGATVTWAAPGGGSVSPATSLTNAAGRAVTRFTMGDALGAATITATIGSLTPASFTANAILGITSITPAILEAGTAVTLNGTNFSPSPAANTLTIGGVAVAVQTATATAITATLPATMPCLPGGDATVSLVTGGITTNRRHPVRTALPRAISVGQILIGSTADPLHCFELPQEGGRYLIAVTNGSGAVGINASLRVRGVSSSATPATVTLPAVNTIERVQSGAFDMHVRHTAHMQLLEKNNAMLEQLIRTRGNEPSQAKAQAQQIVPNAGDTMSIRIPRIAQSNSCATYDSIRARVVAVGTRGAVLEDVTNPFAGTIDTLYQRIATEFDNTQYTTIRDNFGDPLLMDAQLDNNGKVLMVFSNRVNNVPGILGFAWSGDFGTRQQCLQSNMAEVFYGVVPTVNDQNYGNGNGTIGAWYWLVRSTVTHEVKHLAHFATRFSASRSFEEAWLEEALAMIAEELWARRIFGYAQGANVGYLQSVGCEIRGVFNIGACTGRPGVTIGHFSFLYDWMGAPSTQSLLCAASNQCTGSSIYGSAWLFVRWLLDQSTQPEAALLRAMHDATQFGGANVQARFGRPFAELFADWVLAVALDDRTGFTPPSALYTVPSWNLRDVYGGLNFEQAQAFPSPFPLLQAAMSYGNAEINIPTIRGGSAAFFELSGTPTGRQVLEFTNTSGQPLTTNARVSIVRIQ